MTAYTDLAAANRRILELEEIVRLLERRLFAHKPEHSDPLYLAQVEEIKRTLMDLLDENAGLRRQRDEALQTALPAIEKDDRD